MIKLGKVSEETKGLPIAEVESDQSEPGRFNS